MAASAGRRLTRSPLQYQAIGAAIEQSGSPNGVWGTEQQARSRVARFRDAWVTGDGVIVDAASCGRFSVRNNGCASPYAWRAAPDVLASAAVREDVISLAIQWGAAHYHFPMEAAVGLLHGQLRRSDDTWVHVSKRTDFVLSWLQLFGIRPERVVDGVVLARGLQVPEPSQCGNPSQASLVALRKMLRASHPGVRPPTIVLTRRRKTRVVKNAEKLEAIVAAHATKTGAELLHHDDAQLPPLREQLGMFAAASIVIGPHGAAEVLSVVMPPGSCLVEFLDASDPNLCFARAAVLLGHHYVAVPMGNGRVSEGGLEQALQRCAAQMGAPH